jgi:hypothetical protein
MQQPVISEAGGSFNSFLLLAGAAYFSGVLGHRAGVPPSPDSEDNDEEGSGLRLMFDPIPSPESASALASPRRAWETLKESVGGYVKIALCITLILPFPPQPALHCLLFAVISVVGLFAPTTKLHGPLRFGYLESGRQLHQVYDLVSPWLLYAGAFLYLFPAVTGLFFPGSLLTLASSLLAPTLSLSVAGFATTWYIRTYRAYVAEVAELSVSSAAVVLNATAAASHAQVLVRSTRGYEKQLLDIVAVARRDAALAQSLHVTDFFDCATAAWSALRQVTDPAKEGARLVEQAIALRDDDMSDDEGRGIVQQTQQDVVQNVMKQLNVAQAAVDSCESAKRQLAKGRENVRLNAADATKQARKMVQATIDLEERLYEAVVGAERVKGLVESARVVAAEGEIGKAKKLVGKARAEKEKVESESLKRLRDAEKTAWSILFELLCKV